MQLMEVIGRILVEKEDGTSKMEKRIMIGESSSFTEMEAVGTEFLNSISQYPENTEINSIKKLKYSAVYYNEYITSDVFNFGLVEYTPESEDGNFWLLTVAFTEELDDGKEKIVKEKFLMPALTQLEAIQKLAVEMGEIKQPWEIIDGKKTDIYSVLVLEATDINLRTNFGVDLSDE